ncbi:MAG: hypothetical protein JWL72_796 [Ilumatobacteraceae bacterium]|nr:hypothetical protein [Ilumatobacteraceae bacterium]
MSTWPTRPATNLLAVPFALTQTGVLTASALVREAEVRGWKPTVETLVVLADAGLFVPLFELIDQAEDDLIVDPTAGICEWPFEAHVQAMAVRDPAGGRFDRTRLEACRYSHWQLLWFHGVGWDQLHPKTEEALRDIANDEMLRPWFEQAASSYRQLAIVLEAVAASYMPFVSNRVSQRGHHTWSPANTKDSGSLLAWLSVAADLVHGQAEMLLLAARNVDPLAEWSPLTGHASSEARHKLKGAALVAVDLREAAELLLQLYDDLPDAQLSTAMPSRIGTYWQPLHERLKRPRAERDRILNDLGLTPFPSLIVAVEGHTEEAIIAKALDAFGWRVGLDAIEVVNLRGVGNDVSVLARYAGARGSPRSWATLYCFADRWHTSPCSPIPKGRTRPSTIEPPSGSGSLTSLSNRCPNDCALRRWSRTCQTSSQWTLGVGWAVRTSLRTSPTRTWPMPSSNSARELIVSGSCAALMARESAAPPTSTRCSTAAFSGAIAIPAKSTSRCICGRAFRARSTRLRPATNFLPCPWRECAKS